MSSVEGLKSMKQLGWDRFWKFLRNYRSHHCNSKFRRRFVLRQFSCNLRLFAFRIRRILWMFLKTKFRIILIWFSLLKSLIRNDLSMHNNNFNMRKTYFLLKEFWNRNHFLTDTLVLDSLMCQHNLYYHRYDRCNTSNHELKEKKILFLILGLYQIVFLFRIHSKNLC